MTFTATYFARKRMAGNRRVVAVRQIDAPRRSIAEAVALVWLDYERRHHRGQVVTVTIRRSTAQDALGQRGEPSPVQPTNLSP